MSQLPAKEQWRRRHDPEAEADAEACTPVGKTDVDAGRAPSKPPVLPADPNVRADALVAANIRSVGLDSARVISFSAGANLITKGPFSSNSAAVLPSDQVHSPAILATVASANGPRCRRVHSHIGEASAFCGQSFWHES
jgi:hypothetical protein